MPIYKYKCINCDFVHKQLLSGEEVKSFVKNCDLCGLMMGRVHGSPSVRAMETVDEERGKSNPVDLDRMLEERSKDHFRRHELSRRIDKEGHKKVKEEGFIDDDGNSRI